MWNMRWPFGGKGWADSAVGCRVLNGYGASAGYVRFRVGFEDIELALQVLNANRSTVASDSEA